jgi:hypothetical protein
MVIEYTIGIRRALMPQQFGAIYTRSHLSEKGGAMAAHSGACG